MARKTTKMYKDKIKEKVIDQSYTATLLLKPDSEGGLRCHQQRSWLWPGEIDGTHGHGVRC
jgi:hypothetical protein